MLASHSIHTSAIETMKNESSYSAKIIQYLRRKIFGRSYDILDKLIEAFDQHHVCPEVLYLGDSTVFRVSNDDEDKRSTSDMLAEYFKGTYRVLELSHGAYHLEIFYHLLRILKRMRHRPRLIILPINMRSFSPQWYLRPNWQFRAEIELLIRYYSGHIHTRRYRKHKYSKYQDAYEKKPVHFPLSEIRTIGEFEDIRLSHYFSKVQQDRRTRELFIYFYLYPISEEHPLLIKLREILSLAKILNCKIMAYITPINIVAARRNVGQEFDSYFSKNLNIVSDVFEKKNSRVITKLEIFNIDFLNDSAICLDYSRGLGSDYFFHDQSIDDHLNQKGRRLISNSVGAAAVKWLEKEQPVEIGN